MSIASWLVSRFAFPNGLDPQPGSCHDARGMHGLLCLTIPAGSSAMGHR